MALESEDMVMAYRVWVGKTPIDCDTPEAALELALQIESDTTVPRNERPRDHHATPGENGSSRWTPKRATEFFRLIDGNQRKLMDALVEHNDGRTDQQLMSLLGL